MAFRALGLSDKIIAAVQAAGYTEPTPIQAAAIPEILAGRDVIGLAQTGTGKTAAFALPILDRLVNRPPSGPPGGVRALVIAPTRELAAQIDENMRTYGRGLSKKVAAVFGGVNERPQIAALRSGVDIVIATPGRLLDLFGFGRFENLEVLVLDEADRMLDMGFMPQIRQVLRRLPALRQTLLFSATMPAAIETLTRQFQRSPKIVQIGRRADPATTVTQWVYEVAVHLKPGLLLHLLQDPKMNMVLVFTRTKHGADRLAGRLDQAGVKTGLLHSNRSQGQRLKALKAFKDGAVRVLVATDIAARGIDVDGISHVVNFDFPPHPEDYVHRIGRTGRAQAIGDAISLVAGDEYSALRSLERFLGRGLPRRRAEDFDYSVADPRLQRKAGFRPAQSDQPHPQRRFGSGGSSGGRPAPRRGSWAPRGR